jgi:hypothetical protein
MAEARALIAQETDGIPWRGVRIVAGPVTTGASSYLAASAGQAECEFRVDVNGQPSRVRASLLEPALGVYPSAARIQVVRRGPDEPMSRAQWVGVQALIAAMGEAVAGQPIPVRLGEAWARIYNLDPETVLDVSPSGKTPS